jgi:hypothetical protein
VHDDARPGNGSTNLDVEPTSVDPAIADAQAIVERIGIDEREARLERDRLQGGQPFHAPVPGPGAPPLLPGEAYVDVRSGARVERMGAEGTEPLSGRLYLTTERLVLSGQGGFAVDLQTIDEVSLIGDKLLVALEDGTGLCLDVSSPRVFRVHISHAIALLRSVVGQQKAVPDPASQSRY